MLKQLLTSMILPGPAFIVFALAAHSAEITPQTQPDCAQVVCTQDGAELPQEPVIVLPPPYVGDESAPVVQHDNGFVWNEVAVPCKVDGKVIKGCWIK